MQCYDEVEQKLTLVTKKISMTHDREGVELLNREVRSDALHPFISRLNKTIKAIDLPKDLPSTLALAREAEASIKRSIFASTYAHTQASEAKSIARISSRSKIAEKSEGKRKTLNSSSVNKTSMAKSKIERKNRTKPQSP